MSCSRWAHLYKMHIWKAYRQGLSLLFRHSKMWFILYGWLIGLALVSVFPLYSLLKSQFTHSLAIRQSLGRFDYTFLTDFLNQYGEAFYVVIKQSYVILGIFFMLWIFAIAGVVYIITRSKSSFSIRSFFDGGLQFFWRFISSHFLFSHHSCLVLYTTLVWCGLVRHESIAPG